MIKISELIEQLEQYKEKYGGDLGVVVQYAMFPRLGFELEYVPCNTLGYPNYLQLTTETEDKYILMAKEHWNGRAQ